MNKKICKICNKKQKIKFLNLKKQPFANKYPKNSKEIRNEKKFNMNIDICTNCLAVQLSKIAQREEMFEDYYYLSSVNQKLVNHFKKLSKSINKNKFVVDVGSNDGIFLEPLKKRGIKFVGIDPSKNVGEIANKKGLKTYISFFNKKVVDKIIKTHGKADIVVASSIFTHLKNPLDFVKNVKKLININGTVIIEIEYVANFIKNLEFERFYFDRPFYYSIKSMMHLFKKYEMHLNNIDMIDIHGSSVRLYFENKKKVKYKSKISKILKDEAKTLNLKKLLKFSNLINLESHKFKLQLKKFKKNGHKVIGYGCPARLATITNYAKIGNDLIEFIIEDSFLKQNKFSPGMHIPIVDRKDINLKNYNIVIVFAYEYIKEIKLKINKQINKKLMYYKPIPFKSI